ncbi:nuclear transport factor 2 family protein [Pseudonocardia halophobica]|uniref:nuclear transport factor 2 family protein n=1 Tax=Pseudonocardia halophobica TaxID=29401 RepID=UPI003D8FCA66
MSEDAAKVVEQYVDAYNAQDFEGMEAVLSPELDFQHYNRGFSFSSAAELVATLRAFASDYLPDRKLGPSLRTNVIGDTVYREQRWGGTLAVDLPGFGNKGDVLDDRLLTVYTVRDGKITEYYDYG